MRQLARLLSSVRFLMRLSGARITGPRIGSESALRPESSEFLRFLKFFLPFRNSALRDGESRVYSVANKSIASNALTRKVRTNPSSESRRLLRAGGGRPESHLRAVEFERHGRSPGNSRCAPWQVGLDRRQPLSVRSKSAQPEACVFSFT